ncbi:SGNH/GDSL hydrolase family protein [Clostridium sp. C105KSO13]|uniref:SGNH/GDSL hydrolase family protein n=1 Tax=Clostridium sp. C105KSO13 TaxID=1776045 RepID=UPI00074064FE|nr:SGNH/GDSL hydrolase family protein [Clostridium sp. C105KSO13]CUX29946.1 Acetylxylan esterase precursor [Clostridium sp. C105KSO13]
MKTILCYGDSNTYGLKSDLLTRYAREERWTGILQKSLGEDYYVIEEGLGGRTTVWDDPIEEYKNGKKYLLPCLDSHKPIDLVIVMLGTNDLKSRFSVTPFDISVSVENIVKTLLKSDAGIDFEPPKVLLVTPVPIHSVGNRELDQMLPNMEERSEMLAEYYQNIAENYHVEYLNPGKEIEVNDTDGIHYTLKGHQQMASVMEKKIREILL